MSSCESIIRDPHNYSTYIFLIERKIPAFVTMTSFLFEQQFSRISSRLWRRLQLIEGVRTHRGFKRISTKPLPARTGVMAIKKFYFPFLLSNNPIEE